MGMRNDDKPSTIKVTLGSSENEQIIMFRCIEGYKSTDADNPKLLKTIVDNVKNDFTLKCIALLETCTTMPDTLYTYDVFNKMFSFMQEGDCTASKEKEVYKFLISDGEDIDEIVKNILDGYVDRNYKLSERHPGSVLTIKELLGVPGPNEDKLRLVRRMFGSGEFPFLKVKYAWHEGRSEWHYAYHIVR